MVEVIIRDVPVRNMTYENFLKDLAQVLAPMLKECMEDPSGIVSQRQAYRKFGEGNVKRWRRQLLLEPVAKRPGKIEYRIADLRTLQQRQQDYFDDPIKIM